MGISVSAMNSKIPSKGRPYGGTAILWKKTLANLIATHDCHDPRLSAVTVTLTSENNSLLIINCYFPTADKPDEQSEYLGKISSIVENSSSSCYVICGDFNISPSSSNFLELKQLAHDLGLVILDVEKLSPDSLVNLIIR